IHMGIALVITALLIYVVTRSQKNLFSARHLTRIPYLKLLLFIALMLTFIQILLGTQVRQDVDTVAASFDYTNRHLWIDNLGRWFYIHRSFSIAVFLFNVLLIYVLKKNVKAESTLNESYPTGKFLIWSSGYLLLGLFLQIITGIVMAYFNIPLYLQPVHLLLGTLIFGIQFFMLLMLNYSESLTKIPKFRAK
ncbi:MAG: COX15/CtaA family protein, partial [Bacteroidetes bacterium]|nr:COX15/CtaA family protein [Bacteroidota bacterium]